MQEPAFQRLPRKTRNTLQHDEMARPVVSERQENETENVQSRSDRAVGGMVRRCVVVIMITVHSPYPPPVDVFRAKADTALRTNGEHRPQECLANVPDIQNVRQFFNRLGIRRQTVSANDSRTRREKTYPFPNASCMERHSNSYAADDVNTAPRYGCARSCLRWCLMQLHSNSLPRRRTTPSSITRWLCPAVRVKKATPRETYRVEAGDRLVWRMVRVSLCCCDDTHSPY